MSIGERIKDLRFFLKIKQINFAKEINMKSASVSNFEKDIIYPSLKTVMLINEKFNVNLNWLLTGKGSMFIEEKQKPEIKASQTVKGLLDINRKLIEANEMLAKKNFDLIDHIIKSRT